MKLVKTGPNEYSIEGLSQVQLLVLRRALVDSYDAGCDVYEFLVDRVHTSGIRPDAVAPGVEM